MPTAATFRRENPTILDFNTSCKAPSRLAEAPLSDESSRGDERCGNQHVLLEERRGTHSSSVRG